MFCCDALEFKLQSSANKITSALLVSVAKIKFVLSNASVYRQYPPFSVSDQLSSSQLHLYRQGHHRD